jgi:hypothetical protein
MLRNRMIALITGLVLVVAVAVGSAGIATGLVTADAPQAIACNTGGTSGGGC